MTSKKKIKPIPNPEKNKHEKWGENDDWLDFPRPFRWCIMGRPSCGKTSLILNYLIKGKPYDNIFLLHPQTYTPNVSHEDESINRNIILDKNLGQRGSEGHVPQLVNIPEYQGVDFHPLAYIPSMTYFDNLKKHSLLIIDDIDLVSFMKKRRDLREERLNKLFSYVSTHKNLSIIVSSQDPSSQLPNFILKMCNVITVYQVRDEYIVQTMARKLSIGYRRLKTLLDVCSGKHDNLTFDYTDNSPAEIRCNIYTAINDRGF